MYADDTVIHFKANSPSERQISRVGHVTFDCPGTFVKYTNASNFRRPLQSLLLRSTPEKSQVT